MLWNMKERETQMTKHTPGPWAVNGYNLAEVIAIRNGPDAEGRSYIDGRHQVSVAIVPTGGKRDFETARADARLIASAPGLLERVEKMAWLLAELHAGNEFSKDFYWQQYEKTIVVRNKAMGE